MVNETNNKSTKVISENLEKNIELYNKYTLLLSSIFISALTAIGKIAHFTATLKLSVLLFSIALAATLIEISILIVMDSFKLETMQCNILKKIPERIFLSISEKLAILSLMSFLLGIIAVNIFIFKL